MKKFVVLVFTIMLLLTVTSCKSNTNKKESQTSDISELSTTTESIVENESEEKITNIDEMIKLKSIVSIEKSKDVLKTSYSYDVIFNSGELKIKAQIVAPKNYLDKNCPVVLYFPEISPDTATLDASFAQNGIIVVRLFTRGTDESEGVKDLGGSDFTDAVALLEILRRTDLFEGSKIFLAGSSEGSITALKTAENASELIDGCAVINVISDLESYIAARGDTIKQYIEMVIGSSIDENPEEYSKRSAVNFADKINVPVLILTYEDSIPFPRAQADALYKSLEGNNKTCKLFNIDEISSDFINQTALRHLLSWINENN